MRSQHSPTKKHIQHIATIYKKYKRNVLVNPRPTWLDFQDLHSCTILLQGDLSVGIGEGLGCGIVSACNFYVSQNF